MKTGTPPAGSVKQLVSRHRPQMLHAAKNTRCCFARLLIQCDGIYRCPCGRKQERLAEETLANAPGSPTGQEGRQ